MNKLKINKFWFTLIELMVWIAIVSILLLWVSNINFNTITNQEKLRDFNNWIITNIETVRNYALLWKWESVSTIIPESWHIDIAKVWSWWYMSTSYNSGWTLYSSPQFYINFTWWYIIESIRCLEYDNTEIHLFDETTDWIWSLIFKWGNISWSWSLLCDNSNTKV